MAGIMNFPKGEYARKGCIPYSNKDAVRNGINYVTGTGRREDKQEVKIKITNGNGIITAKVHTNLAVDDNYLIIIVRHSTDNKTQLHVTSS